jgi:hypothetical protein
MAENNIASDPGARRMIGRVLGIGIIAAAAIMVVVTLVQWEIRPQTDDATVRANFVGIAPQVNGHIVELHVRDNQLVKEGDILFLIDPRPYKIALERARATFALTRKEVDGLRNSAATAVAGVSKAEAQLNASASQVTSREMDPIVADAEIARLEAQFQHADEHLKRVEPLLPLQFVTTDNVEKARTERASALAGAQAGCRRHAGVHTRSTHCYRGGAATGPQSTGQRRGQYWSVRGYQCQNRCGRGGGAFGGIRFELQRGTCAVHGPGGQYEYIKRRLRPGRRGGVHHGGYSHLVRRGELP